MYKDRLLSTNNDLKKRRPMAVNKQNCSYSTRLLFFFFFFFFYFVFFFLFLFSSCSAVTHYMHVFICHYRCSRPSTTITYKYTHAREREQPLNTTNYYHYYNSLRCVCICIYDHWVILSLIS